jgi:hypothetical protein
MPLNTPDERPLAVTQIVPTVNQYKILGFEVHTDGDDVGGDTVFVRREARRVVNGVVQSRYPLRGTVYTASSMLPVMADILRRCLAAGATANLDDATLGGLLYVAFRDALYADQKRLKEFPADAV